MKINKDKLVQRILDKSQDGSSFSDVNLVTTEFFDEITNSLVSSERIEFRGFGSFSLRNRKVPVDPRTNNSGNSEKINCRSVYFRMAKDLNDKLNS